MATNHNASIKFFSLKASIRAVSLPPITRCCQLRYLTRGEGGLYCTGEPCLVLFLEIRLSFLIRKTPGEHQEVKYFFAGKRPGLPNVLSLCVGESLQKAARNTGCWVHPWLPTSVDRFSFSKLHASQLTTPWGLSIAQGRTSLLERPAPATAISESLRMLLFPGAGA